MTKLNATSATILGFLQDEPQSGWDLVSTIERSVGFFWNITQSQIYRELGALEEAGLIRERGQQGRAKRFASTKEGTLAFHAWINRPPGEALMRLPIVLAVFFGNHIEPEKLRRFLMTEKLSHEARLDEYLALEPHAGESPYGRATLDLGIAYERMMIAWLEGLPWLASASPADTSRAAAKRRRKTSGSD